MSDAKYFVKKVQTCCACKGEKRVQHPAWAEYWKEHEHGNQDTTLEQDREWFESHGWYSTSSFDMRTDGTPDEEIMCGECEGEGEIVSEVDLLEVLKQWQGKITLNAKMLEDMSDEDLTHMKQVVNVHAMKGDRSL